MAEKPRKNPKNPIDAKLPETTMNRLLGPVQRFMHVQAASGIVLLICTVTALVLANSPYAKTFISIWKTPIEFSIGSFHIADTVGHLLINDGLMTIFFFVVGLEVKREIIAGELRDPRKALLPIVAALGGMVGPALVYLAFQYGEPGERGWAIPMATDIAFVVGFLALFGKRVPFGLKIFLLSLAIVDDIGAVLVIATVYTNKIAMSWLLVAAIGFVVTYSLNLLGVRRVPAYIVVGAVIWLAFLKAGIHPTVAGVMLGLMTPSSAWLGDKTFSAVIEEAWTRMRGGDYTQTKSYEEMERIGFALRESVSPLTRLETILHPWVAFGIMPLFALSNAGVTFNFSLLKEPVAIAVAAGLVLGKPLGIILTAFIAVKLGLTRLPANVNWLMMISAGCLAGIGFTMSLFINGLAFNPAEFPSFQSAGKIGTMTGSLISSLLGGTLLVVSIYLIKKKAPAAKTEND
ncbi:MAG: Na+/H+ antiporter NhaA [Zavarzinella sp.]